MFSVLKRFLVIDYTVKETLFILNYKQIKKAKDFGSGSGSKFNCAARVGSGRVGSDDLGYGPGSGFSFEPVQNSTLMSNTDQSMQRRLKLNASIHSPATLGTPVQLLGSNSMHVYCCHVIGWLAICVTKQLNRCT